MSKKFLSIGDVLINPDLLAYAVLDAEVDELEGPGLRLGFASAGGPPSDLRLKGQAAGEVLRWLRLNADFLNRSTGHAPIPAPRDRHSIARSPELAGRA